MSDKRYILKKTNGTSSNHPTGERVYDTLLEKELYAFEIVDLLNNLIDERDYWKGKCKEWNLKGKNKHLSWKPI